MFYNITCVNIIILLYVYITIISYEYLIFYVINYTLIYEIKFHKLFPELIMMLQIYRKCSKNWNNNKRNSLKLFDFYFFLKKLYFILM